MIRPVYVATLLVTTMAIFMIMQSSTLLPDLALGSMSLMPIGFDDRGNVTGNMTANNETFLGQGENISSTTPMKLDGLIL